MKSLVLPLLLLNFCNAIDYEFPDGFLFGVATASYQVEGAWNTSGKGENIWDRLTHTRPELITDRSNGDIACDAYHKTKGDVELLKNLGVDFYRFSISWPRILPTGHSNRINPDGVRYYNELIDELIANNITPFVTMYHWDLPWALQELGGWPNPILADYFADYADVLFELFGDRVRNWITFNEPTLICEHGYSLGGMAPAYNQSGVGGYLCGHTLLIAHGRAYRLYNEKYREIQKGRIGITCETMWSEPANNNSLDIEAAENTLQMNFGWFVHPILSETGDYPSIMRRKIDDQSKLEGYKRSRLPHFSEEEIDMIRGSSDFLGLNHYTSRMCSKVQREVMGPSHELDIGANCYAEEAWEPSASTWLKVVPWGMRKLLNWIRDEYKNVEVIITENGFSDTDGLNDCRRVNYYNSYLAEVLKAIHEDKCNVTGYTAWSFMDNFEWVEGYTERFGMHFVDFENPDRPRIPKMSSHVYKRIIETRKIDLEYTPDGFAACIW